jgi:methionine sulfoxide reductase heme-binding subunit
MMSRLAPIYLAIILSAAALAVAMVQGNDAVEDWGLAARYTARISFPIFIVTYTASSLVRLWPGVLSKHILSHRRQWGLGFAFAHTVHLAALTWAHVVAGSPPSLQTLLGGGLAYALMYVMALTSNNRSVKLLGRWWKRIHMAGIHWLWAIFLFSYAGRIFDPERRWQGVIFTSIALAALGLRVAARLKSRRARRPVTGLS